MCIRHSAGNEPTVHQVTCQNSAIICSKAGIGVGANAEVYFLCAV